MMHCDDLSKRNFFSSVPFFSFLVAVNVQNLRRPFLRLETRSSCAPWLKRQLVDKHKKDLAKTEAKECNQSQCKVHTVSNLRKSTWQEITCNCLPVVELSRDNSSAR